MQIITLHTKESVLLDDDIALWAAKHTWLSCLSLTTSGISVVAVARIGGKLVYLHQHILGISKDKSAAVMFKDGNTLNMQRDNMSIMDSDEE